MNGNGRAAPRRSPLVWHLIISIFNSLLKGSWPGKHRKRVEISEEFGRGYQAWMMNICMISNQAAVKVIRDGNFQNLGFLKQAQREMLVFVESDRFLRTLHQNSNITAVITTSQLAASISAGLAVGICDQPRITFAKIHNALSLQGFYWEDFATSIDPEARVHPSAYVAAKNVRIGPGTRVDPHATILERCLVGADVRVGAGCVLGGVGLQTVRNGATVLEMEHAGGLVVHDSAHLLPGAVIATGLFRQNTTISRDARVGSQAFVSHGVYVGERAILGHGSIVNGNARIGRDAWIGPGAVIAQELEIGEGAFVSLGSAVIGTVKPGERVSGNFAISHRRLLRKLAGQTEQGRPKSQNARPADE
jgi:UDP-3-O-[3-hydroxymyristoyl] glucosamine N-acyltransferase